MAISLANWARPHKGPPKHLSDFEIGLRYLVFYPIWIILFLPTVLFVLFVAFGGPIALAAMYAFGYNRITSEQEFLFFFCVGFFAISYAASEWVKRRFLTPKWYLY